MHPSFFVWSEKHRFKWTVAWGVNSDQDIFLVGCKISFGRPGLTYLAKVLTTAIRLHKEINVHPSPQLKQNGPDSDKRWSVAFYKGARWSQYNLIEHLGEGRGYCFLPKPIYNPEQLYFYILFLISYLNWSKNIQIPTGFLVVPVFFSLI